jgi:predicted metal-dependent peptidase
LESDLRQREGVDLPFERATSAARMGRIALAMDTSGSIGESLLRRFAAEVAAILAQTELLLRLIVCDADVHQIYDFSGREGAKALRGFRFKGGGGTDFRPAIAEAAKWEPDRVPSGVRLNITIN